MRTAPSKPMACPCGAGRYEGRMRPTVSLVLQLATIGRAKRLRARASTIIICKECMRDISDYKGAKLRRAIADALVTQDLDLKKQVSGQNAQ